MRSKQSKDPNLWGIPMSELVLICEDEKDIQEILSYNLKLSGFETVEVGRGDQILNAVSTLKPSLILLDLMLPGMSGTEVCRQIRSDSSFHSIPIIMVTAKHTEVDRVVGLELGADDYITKPFSPKEVVARVKAVLRRTQLGKIGLGSVLQCGEIKIDLKEYKAFVRENEVHLTLTEFKILKELLAAPGQVVSRTKLGDSCHGSGSDSAFISRTIDVHLVALRKKMGPSGELIETVRGVGYRFRN